MNASSFQLHSIAYLAVALRHPVLFLSFPLCKSTRVPQRRLFLLLLHKFTVFSRTTTWHDMAWWDKQHFYTRSHIVFQVAVFSAAGPSRQLSLLCVALDSEAVFVTHSIWFSHMAKGCLVKPGAGLSSPAKEFHFYVTNGTIHYVPPGLSGHFALKSKTSLSPCPFTRAAKTSFVTTSNCNGMLSLSSRTCPLIIHPFPKLPRLALYVFDE